MPEGDAALVAGFWQLVDDWRLTLAEQFAIAGVDRATLYAWKQAPPARLDPALAGRLAGLLAVDVALRARLAQPERAHEWLRKPHRSSLLRGHAPLQRLLDGSNDALGAVSRIVAMPG